MMKKCGPGGCVPLAFMYKHHAGYFVKFVPAATLAKYVPTFSPGAVAKDPVDREDGLDLGEVSAEVVALAAVNLQQAKSAEGPKGLMARLLCCCLAPENDGRDFVGTITGGKWLLSQLAGIVPYENCDCIEWLHEKSHGDVLAKAREELFGTRLAPHDTRKLGYNTELKALFPDDDGVLSSPYIKSNDEDDGFRDLREWCRAHGGRTLLCARTHRVDGRVRQSIALARPLADACDDLTYHCDGERPHLVFEVPPPSSVRPTDSCLMVRRTRDARPSRGAPPGSAGTVTWDSLHTVWHNAGKKNPFRWKESGGTRGKVPEHKLHVEKLALCCEKNSWGSNIEGTPAEVDAATGRQILDLLDASGEAESYMMSMEGANSTVNGEDGKRLTYNKGMLTVAQIIGARAFRIVTEAKEHLVILLADGRIIIITTAACTLRKGDDVALIKLNIDLGRSKGQDPLLWRQTAANVIVINFSSATYEFCLGGNQYSYEKNTRSVPAPRDGRLFCVLRSDLPLEVREKFARGISVPKNLMFKKLLAVNGIEPDAAFLAKAKAHESWQGGDVLYAAIENGLVDASELSDKVREVGAPWADWLGAASVLGPGLDLDALCARLPPATYADVRRVFAGATLAPAPHDDGFGSYLKSDERKAWAGEEVAADDADSMDDAPPAPSDDLVPPAGLDAARNVQGDGGAARENRAAVPVAPPLVPPPNLGAAASVVAGRPVPRSGFDDDGPIGPTFTTPMHRALPDAPRKRRGPQRYRPQDDIDAPRRHFTFSDSDDEEKL